MPVFFILHQNWCSSYVVRANEDSSKERKTNEKKDKKQEIRDMHADYELENP